MKKSSKTTIRLKNLRDPSVFVAVAFALLIGGIGGYYVGSSHAEAGYSALCLNSAAQYCIQTYGGTSQAAIKTGATSRFTLVPDSNYGQYITYLIKNESNNCLTAYATTAVDAEPCNKNAAVQQWAYTDSNPERWLNVASAKAGRKYYLATNGVGNNSPLYILQPVNNIWWGWKQ